MARLPHKSAAEILVVDDDSDLRETLADALIEYGFTVATAPGGATALDYLRTNPVPRVVIVDLKMPDVTGTDFIDRMRSLGGLSHIRLIVYTASADPDEQLLASLGVYRALRKPVPMLTLIALLNEGR